MMKTILIAFMFAVVARADLGPGPINTKWYMDNCSRGFRLEVDADGVRSTIWDDTAEHNYCAGMLKGIYEIVADIYAKGPVIPLSVYQLNTIVVTWVNIHPGKDDLLASGQLFSALSETFRRATKEKPE